MINDSSKTNSADKSNETDSEAIAGPPPPPPPLRHAEARFDLLQDGKPHSPSFPSQSSSSSSSESSLSGWSVQERLESSLASAGDFASALISGAVESGRAVAGRLSGTSSRPATLDSDSDSAFASVSGPGDSNNNHTAAVNQSLAGRVALGLEHLSRTGSATLSAAIKQSRTKVAQADQALHISESIRAVDDSLGVTAAVHQLDRAAADSVSHVYTAIKRGHPLHAITHARSAAAIGAAEVKKHAKGPLPTTNSSSNSNSPDASNRYDYDYDNDNAEHSTDQPQTPAPAPAPALGPSQVPINDTDIGTGTGTGTGTGGDTEFTMTGAPDSTPSPSPTVAATAATVSSSGVGVGTKEEEENRKIRPGRGRKPKRPRVSQGQGQGEDEGNAAGAA